MPLLEALWLASLAVFAASVATILLVLLRRLVVDGLHARRLRRRRALEGLLFPYLDGTVTADHVHAAIRGRVDAALLAAVVRELLELLRGRDAGRLRELLGEPRLLDALLSAARRGIRADRLDAVETLALVPAPEVAETLRRLAMTDGEDPVVRATAARALHARDPRLLDAEALASVLAVEAAATLAAPLLRRLAAERLDTLLELLRAPQSPAVLTALLDALGHAQDYRLALSVAGFVDHPDVSVRAAAVAALARFGDPRTGAAVLAALRDAAWEVRAAAAGAAGGMRLAAASPALQGLLEDEVWPVRHAAAVALLGLGGEGSRALAARAAAGDRAGRVSQMVLAEREAAAPAA